MAGITPVVAATVAGMEPRFYVANERHPPGTRVTVDDFEPGDYHVCHDWPEDVPEYLRGSDNVHIAGYTSAGVLAEAWVQRSRLHAVDGAMVTITHSDHGTGTTLPR